MKPSVDRVLQFTLVLAVCALAGVLWDALRDKIVDVGERAPEFRIVTDRGVSLSASSFGGKVLILNFWATWCPPCVKETPALEAIHRQLGDRGVVVLGISVDKNERKYQDFLRRFGVTFNTYRDAEARIADLYGTYRYPETYVIDRNGRVAQKIIGAEWTEADMTRFVNSLL